MLKMSFLRVPMLSDGYRRRPIHPMKSCFSVNIVENEISPFIIYGDDCKPEFKSFNSYEDLREDVHNMVRTECAKYNTKFIPKDDRYFSVKFTVNLFKQDYLSESWYNNDKFFNSYCTSQNSKLNRNDLCVDYSEIKETFTYLGKRMLIGPVFESLSNADQNSLNGLLNELLKKIDTRRYSTAIKAYSKNPLFGMF